MTAIDIDTIELGKGAHGSFQEGACLLEAASFIAGEPWSDHPACVSPVLGAYGRSLNDSLPHDRRQELKDYVPQLIGTAEDGQDEARSYLALDWLIRTYTPAFLDLAGLTREAQELRSLRRIVDLVAAQTAGPVVRNAQKKSDAAWDAAWDAAGDAARARAAWVAARDAARDAAGDAARDALKPTVDQLQTSAIALLGVMINPAVIA
jgi:hypothetical protein